jgi:hypothetical protein
MGITTVIRPRLRHSDKKWHFLHYWEAPSERQDRLWFDALYFRNSERTLFGKIEFVGAIERRNWRSIATKIATDSAYRDGLLSEDPFLPRLWKRH